MDIAIAILAGISLSACTGFRAFLPPFIIGLLQKFLSSPASGMLFPGLSFLSNTPVLIALGIAVVVEFLGDKIPWVDHALDTIQLPVKFVVTSVISCSIIPPEHYNWVVMLFTLVIGTGTTVTVHAGKAGLRAASTASSGGLLNPFISLAEEALALAGTVLTFFLPILAGLFILAVIWKCLAYLFGKSGGNEGQIAKTAPSFKFLEFIKFTSRTGLKLYNRLTIEGRENLPPRGPFVVVANHASMLDGFILGSVVPTPMYIMVKKEAFDNPIQGYLLRKILAFPVTREHPEPTAIKFTFKILQDGYAFGLFPEGTRNRKGLISPFKPGAFRIGIKQQAPIIPAYISNTHLFSPDGTWVPRPVKITIKFGPPIEIQHMIDAGRPEEEIQNQVYDAVCRLGQEVMGVNVAEPLLNAEIQRQEPLRTVATPQETSAQVT